jgi:REP element-mobilizing transposase RayT
MSPLSLYDGASIYFVTMSLNNHIPLFRRAVYRDIIINSLLYCINHKALRMFAYVIMPSHLHMIVFDAELNNERLHQTMGHFRSYTAHKLTKELEVFNPVLLEKKFTAEKEIDRKYRIWASGYHPIGLTSNEFISQKFAYIHNNPANAGLVSDPVQYPYSSALFWETGKKGILPIHDYLDLEAR